MDAIDEGPSTVSAASFSLTDELLTSQQQPPAPNAWQSFLDQFYRAVQQSVQLANQFAQEGADWYNNLPPDAREFMDPPETRTPNAVEEELA
jgi:hypothetical protein